MKKVAVIFVLIIFSLSISYAVGSALSYSSKDILLDVPFFSQRDPKWCDDYLDNSPYKIHDYGCALTSTTMVVNYFGYDTDPGKFNNELSAIGGIDSSGLLHWDKVEEATGGVVDWIGRVDSADWDRIDEELSNGYPVIASVQFSGKQHFIVFRGKVGTEYHFYDPWDKTCVDRVWPNGALGTYTLKGLRIFHGTPPSPSPTPSPSPSPSPTPSEINITDAEAIYETNLVSVSIPTVPTPVTKIFMFATEAYTEQCLENVSVPTSPVPVSEIFMHLEEANMKESLINVSIPTKPVPVSGIFMHLAEASMEESLIKLQMCKIEIYTDKTNYTAGDVMCLGLNVTNPEDAMRAGIKIWLNTPTGRNFTLLNTIATLSSGLEYANPCFKRFKLPAIPTGNYTWYALIYEPSTEARISEDNASWYFAGKGGSQERIYEMLKQETPRIHFE